MKHNSDEGILHIFISCMKNVNMHYKLVLWTKHVKIKENVSE